ncbi:MAG: HAMP domain-containing histidine kinase [Cyclobacteriaceae bacterium]|nr:HAMP domain-containing histidine kinase [Cyclobacteriaceae bacterium]
MENKRRIPVIEEDRQLMVEEMEKMRNDLTLANQRLLVAEKFKSNFLSNIRNTIINPFTSILGLSDHIINTDRNAWKTVISLAALIHGEAFKLNFQFNNIFMAAEVESGEVQPEFKQVDVHRLLLELLHRYRYPMRKKAVKYEFNCETSDDDFICGFISDPLFIELILANLIDNAIKFSPQSGKFFIVLDQAQDQLVISIKNQGSSISKVYLPNLFDRFRREDESINSIQSGHGLGLSVCKELVQLLGGNIEVVVDEEPSVEFFVKLPMKNADMISGENNLIQDAILPHEGELF